MIVTRAASTCTLLCELFSLKVKYSSAAVCRHTVLFAWKVFVIYHNYCKEKHYSAEEARVLSRNMLTSTLLFFRSRLIPPTPHHPPFHHDALSGTDVTSILNGSKKISADGWQDRCLCHCTSLTNTWQIVSDSQTVTQISHTTDSCGSNCEIHSRIICMAPGCKIDLSQRTRDSSWRLKFTSHF